VQADQPHTRLVVAIPARYQAVGMSTAGDAASKDQLLNISAACRNCGLDDAITLSAGRYWCGHCGAFWTKTPVDMPLLWEGD
jgi:ribosomal protein S27AE